MARGRPKTFDETQALEAAMLAFWRGGYQATSLDDIMAATGMNRASLYATFGDKRSLFFRCLELYIASFEARAGAMMAGEKTVRAAIAKLLEISIARLTDPGIPSGCLRTAATLECAGMEVLIAEKLVAANRRFESVIIDRLEQARKEGELPESEDPVALGRYFASVIDGMIVLARSDADEKTLASIATCAMRALPSQ